VWSALCQMLERLALEVNQRALAGRVHYLQYESTTVGELFSDRKFLRTLWDQRFQ
jgi:adenylosuccinate lyase